MVVINWIAFGIGALMAVLYAVVCLMMWPYPDLVARNGGGMPQVVDITLALTAFSVVAGLAAWWLQQRRGSWWFGQAALGAALVGLALFVLAQR